jgi:hypothetical protein
MLLQEWGSPKMIIQFSNLSRYWNVHVYWVDPESALVPRKLVKAGGKHIELISADHVWVVVASANAAAEARNKAAGFRDAGGVLDPAYRPVGSNSLQASGSSVATSSTAAVSEEERPDFSPVALLLRPAVTSLAADRCVSMLWVPWNSLSVSQRAHPLPQPKHKVPVERIVKHRDGGDPINPNMHLQIFDISNLSIQRRSDLSRGDSLSELDGDLV